MTASSRRPNRARNQVPDFDLFCRIVCEPCPVGGRALRSQHQRAPRPPAIFRPVTPCRLDSVGGRFR